MIRTAASVGVLVLTAVACNGGEEATTVRVTSSPIHSPTRTPAPARPTPAPTPRPGLEDVRISVQRVATLDAPLAMAVRAGDDGLYIAEKGGRIRRLEDGEVKGTTLDVSGEVSGGSEQGLLGLAFSPEGRFLYVNFTDRSGDTVVREYRFSAGRADPDSARRVLFVGQPFSNHNGGNVAFGPDGHLWIGLGDGGSGGDPQGNGQSLDTLLGKVLRIDPRPSGGNAYGIPSDNPFVGRSGRDEIWAYGLRNPWRFSFDRRTRDLWIGDVGQNRWEEVDFEPASSRGGRNYGWDRLEGKHRFEGDPPQNHVLPIYEYSLSGGNCAVTGGYVYRGSRIPDLGGVYVFADFCAGALRGLRQRDGELLEHAFLGPQVSNLASFGEDASGELYVLSLGGGVFRIVRG